MLQTAHKRLHIAVSLGTALQVPGTVTVFGNRVPFKINSTKKDAGAGWFTCSSPPRIAVSRGL